ncbi:porin [Cupriavidus sp. AcVe19-6a]|nr:porin [Cupriavidus sp. AcVe19-6a]
MFSRKQIDQFLPCLALTCAATAHAQSSVTLYGVMDAGISYVNNQGGHANWLLDTGMLSPNLFGLRGSESLGDGLNRLLKY